MKCLLKDDENLSGGNRSQATLSYMNGGAYIFGFLLSAHTRLLCMIKPNL